MYEYEDGFWYYMNTTFTARCPNDLYHYQACVMTSHEPTETAACRYPVCEHPNTGIWYTDGKTTVCEEDNNPNVFKCPLTSLYSTKMSIPMSSVCDDVCDCRPDCEDEYLCHGYSRYYNCKNSTMQLYPLEVCNNATECPYGDDELEACDIAKNEYRYEICPSSAGFPMAITNYSRCTPLVLCANKRDQINCTSESLVGLTCLVDGRPSTISKNVICNPELRHIYWLFYTQNVSLCDDRIDTACIHLTPRCYVHKHELCDNKTDCVGGEDEDNSLCKAYLTSKTCVTSYGMKDRRYPRLWEKDGMFDCTDRSDEMDENFRNCNYGSFTMYQSVCPTFFVCTDRRRTKIPLELACDMRFSCKDINPCRRPVDIGSTKSSLYKGIYYLSYCLPGLEALQRYKPCTTTQFPTKIVFGVTVDRLVIPREKIDCQHFYGELYVLLSCTGNCKSGSCPLSGKKYFTHKSCMYTADLMSLNEEGYLSAVKLSNNVVHLDKRYQCTESRECTSYDKVCDKEFDCTDKTDEKYCLYPYASDGSNNERYQIFDHIVKLIFTLIVGIFTLVFNMLCIIKNIHTIRKIRTNGAMKDKAFTFLINIGDMLIGIYLVSIASIAIKYKHIQENEWLTSLSCSSLGIISTLGTEITLLAMTLLSVFRVSGVMKEFSVPKPVNRRSVAMVTCVIFTIILLSVVVSIMPLVAIFENYFINEVYYPDNPIFKGFVNKEQIYDLIKRYFGRTLGVLKDLSWQEHKRLVDEMFITPIEDPMEFKKRSFYGSKAVCLFRYFVTKHDRQHSYSLALVSLNIICFFIIAASYLAINIHSKRMSSQVISGSSRTDVRKRNTKLRNKISLIIFTNFALCVPFFVMSILHFLEEIDGNQYYQLFTIFILPFNAVSNPILYTDTAHNIIFKVGYSFKSIIQTSSSRIRISTKSGIKQQSYGRKRQ